MVRALASDPSSVDLDTLSNVAWELYSQFTQFDQKKAIAKVTLEGFEALPEQFRPCIPYCKVLLLSALRSFDEASIDEAVLYSRLELFAYLPMAALFGCNGGFIDTIVDYYRDAYSRAGLSPDHDLLKQIAAGGQIASVEIDAAIGRALERGY